MWMRGLQFLLQPALEIPQDVGDDVVLRFLIHVPDHRRQLGAVKIRSGCPRGLGRPLLPGDLQESGWAVSPVTLADSPHPFPGREEEPEAQAVTVGVGMGLEVGPRRAHPLGAQRLPQASTLGLTSALAVPLPGQEAPHSGFGFPKRGMGRRVGSQGVWRLRAEPVSCLRRQRAPPAPQPPLPVFLHLPSCQTTRCSSKSLPTTCIEEGLIGPTPPMRKQAPHAQANGSPLAGAFGPAGSQPSGRGNAAA